MSEVTAEDIQAKKAELADLMARFKTQGLPSITLQVPAAQIALVGGERYAGAVLDAQGQVMHHLVLLPDRPEDDVDWDAAMAWATALGADLPDRQEQALLFANVKDVLPQRWCWSKETEGSSFAWNCNFYDGYQNFSYRYGGGGAVAVRRLNP